ncbi:SH3 domain-containing protein [Budvicia aquatica]|uniref:Variant SH3 domain n=1 Tax=Budvicia aquatica TaxID=82979 RepID=A0A2C6DKP8_9GAMM|nr:SH3 domain-containing protein [Budvicia aquatica]PHI28902.1 hypothetical protein CRN84_06045 [Budvicia aquatica]VFS47017.1 Variant SH3 domain [Budvicia aquatica]
MKYRVIKQHTSEYPNPIVMAKGDRLIIGEKFDDNQAWNDWYFCETQDRVKGWVPKQVINWLSGNQGEVLTGIKELNGWIWCQHPDSKEEGWVPAENLVQD